MKNYRFHIGQFITNCECEMYFMLQAISVVRDIHVGTLVDLLLFPGLA